MSRTAIVLALVIGIAPSALWGRSTMWQARVILRLSRRSWPKAPRSMSAGQTVRRPDPRGPGRQCRGRRAIIEKGASVTATNQGRFTPLAAAYSGDIKIAELLLEYGADVNAKSELLVTPLHAAAEEDHADMVKLLIARGALLDATEAGGYTPLTRVSIKNRTDMMVLLKQNGAECQAENVTSKAVHSICVAAGR